MGIYSTMQLTREQAEELFNRKTVKDLSDDQLENVLFALFGEPHLNNFSITESPTGITYELNKDKFDKDYYSRDVSDRD